MKRVISILGISLLSTGLFANQNTSNEDINETNAIQSEEQVLELDEYNADYALFESLTGLVSSIGDKLKGLGGTLATYAETIKAKLGDAVTTVGKEICPSAPEKVVDYLKSNAGKGLTMLKEFAGEDTTLDEIKQFFKDRKNDIKAAVCP